MNVQEFILNQKKFCEEKGLPFFMPESDRCWSCSGRMISKLIKQGLTGKDKLITSCPICNKSYCD